MYPLDRYSRAVLAIAAFGSFAGAYTTAPIAARSSAAIPPITVAPPLAPLPAPTSFAVVMPRRDPFGGPGSDTVPRSAAQTAESSPNASMPSLPASLVPLPPNAGAGTLSPPFAAPPLAMQAGRGREPATAPSQPPLATTVIAVVTGTPPYALIEEAGTTRLVTHGDRIADETVSTISVAGVRLASGRVLPVAAGSSFARPSTPSTTGAASLLRSSTAPPLPRSTAAPSSRFTAAPAVPLAPGDR